MIFTSDLWTPPEGYEPPKITHPNPEVMRLMQVLMDADPDCPGYEYTLKGATQGKLYYEIPYRAQIERYIQMAIAVNASLTDTNRIIRKVEEETA